ncbi:hypothetical protein CDD80_6580 [Ophiocordyceps camponoti-rufipedis]|uniref:Uncharacterized protein n=1 Tax=Ophiocordyceps camponoti-rufipedis TaxID=2004952 RepID=A0A2C5XSD8_9HYPO|nr:hypothetical protein CDD80_6580 [Ophiocordyceps camponoti-rufipedis]
MKRLALIPSPPDSGHSQPTTKFDLPIHPHDSHRVAAGPFASDSPADAASLPSSALALIRPGSTEKFVARPVARRGTLGPASRASTNSPSTSETGRCKPFHRPNIYRQRAHEPSSRITREIKAQLLIAAFSINGIRSSPILPTLDASIAPITIEGHIRNQSPFYPQPFFIRNHGDRLTGKCGFGLIF